MKRIFINKGTMQKLWFAGLYVFCSLLIPFVAMATSYSVIDLGPFQDGSLVLGVNNSSQVVGGYRAGSEAHPFLWDNGIVTDLGTFGGTWGFAWDNNDSGQIVGDSQMIISGTNYQRAFLYRNNTMIDLGTLGGNSSKARGINNYGKVTGNSYTGSANRAFLWDSGSMINLGTLGGDEATQANDINDHDQIVGYSDTGSQFHAFIWENGTMTDIGTLEEGNYDSYAHGINNHGQVVGWSYGEGPGPKPFIWEDGKITALGTLQELDIGMAYSINNSGQAVGGLWSSTIYKSAAVLWENGKTYDLNQLIPANSGWLLATAEDINDIGQIVGLGYLNGELHGLLLDPVSETCPEDTLAPLGTVHAYPNVIWASNNKVVTVTLGGRVMDEMSIAMEGGGHGVSSAYLLIDSTDKIVLLDDTTDLLDENGRFNVEVKLRAMKDAEHLIELFAADKNSDGFNSGLVDTTYIQVPHNKN